MNPVTGAADTIFPRGGVFTVCAVAAQERGYVDKRYFQLSGWTLTDSLPEEEVQKRRRKATGSLMVLAQVKVIFPVNCCTFPS